LTTTHTQNTIVKTEANLPRIIALTLLAVILVLAFTGCVSSKYQAARDYPLPIPLNLTATTAPISATVHAVITYHSSGSWKRDAYWDEYLVSVTNRTLAALSVESATLTDFQGAPATPGDNPWLLEKQSLTREQEINHAAKTVLVQAGAGYVAFGFGGFALMSGGLGLGVACLGTLPAYIAGSLYRNHTSRQNIEAEFSRRRHVLPLNIPPGQTAQGSLFFRIAPGPQSLKLAYRGDGAVGTTTIDLTPLGPLHLSQPAPVSPSGLSAPLLR